jgi:hypothetical protein
MRKKQFFLFLLSFFKSCFRVVDSDTSYKIAVNRELNASFKLSKKLCSKKLVISLTDVYFSKIDDDYLQKINNFSVLC